MEIKKCGQANSEVCTKFLAHLFEHQVDHICTDKLEADQYVGIKVLFQSTHIVEDSSLTAKIYATSRNTRRWLGPEEAAKIVLCFLKDIWPPSFLLKIRSNPPQYT